MLTELESKLRPHQRGPFKQLTQTLLRHNSAVDLSFTGSGKTYTAAATAIALGLPTLVVAPKIARSSWERAAAHFGDSFSVVGIEMLRTGNTPFGKCTNYRPGYEFFRCQCCQRIVDPAKPFRCYCHPAGIHCIEVKKKSPHYGQFVFAREVGLVIFDEVHRFGGLDSLNGDMLIGAKRQGKKILGLSATVAANPLQLRALGYALDIHSLDEFNSRLPSFSKWARGHGCVRDPRFHGWKWLVGAERQKETMVAIRSQIRGVRIDYVDVPGFPERDITAELYDLDDPEAVNSCYKVMADSLAALKQKTINDKAPDHPLTKILRARQQVELLKVPIAESLASDYLAVGKSVGIFVNFRQTIEELQKRFPEALVIDGTTTAHRDEYVAEFQRNDCRLVLVNIEAGGVALSLHDLIGGHERVGLVFPGLSATALKQVFGRFHRDGALSRCHYRVLFANKTIETHIHRLIQPKLNNLDALNDGDLSPENLVFA